MAKEPLKPGAAVEVHNISPAAMKVIIDKIAAAHPGSIRGLPDFTKDCSSFSQKDGFTKFYKPGDTTPIVSIDASSFKINAEIVRNIEGR